MKKYLITEEQMTRIMLKESSNIKKGLALKVQDEKGEYYKSIIKEFKSEDDFNEWKDNLDPSIELIGDMDIENEIPETINESKYDELPKVKKDIGFYMLFKTLKDATEELGEVTQFNDEGVVINIDMEKYLNDLDDRWYEDYMERCDDDLRCVFGEMIGNEIDPPKFSVDDRWYPDVDKGSFNSILDERLGEVEYEMDK
jgi:hypothetical protein